MVRKAASFATAVGLGTLLTVVFPLSSLVRTPLSVDTVSFRAPTDEKERGLTNGKIVAGALDGDGEEPAAANGKNAHHYATSSQAGSSTRKFLQRKRQGREAGDRKKAFAIEHPGAAREAKAESESHDDAIETETTAVGLPILVMGMMKAGTTTITEYFECGGRHTVSHHSCTRNGQRKGKGKCGIIARKNALANQPPLQHTGDHDVYAQLDAWALKNRRKFGNLTCYMPQIELLDELHVHYPTATLLLNTRNVSHWIRSLDTYHGGSVREQMTRCNITGLPSGKGGNDTDLKLFYERHLDRVRSFAASHPSHPFVEVDVESADAGAVMEKAFGINQTCWGHANKSKNVTKTSKNVTEAGSSEKKFEKRKRQGREAGDKKKGSVPFDSASKPPPAAVSDAKQDANVSLPILVMGMPKAGTTTITQYFECGGQHTVSHHSCIALNGTRKSDGKCGIIARSNALANQPPLQNTGDHDVYAQLDAWALKNPKFGKLTCYMPQIELLDELHRHYPTATLLLNTRNVSNWIRSLNTYHGGNERKQMIRCNITGLPSGKGGNDTDLKLFYQWHLDRVRSFAASHPSHLFVEVDIESADAGAVMEKAFGINQTCWGHANISKNVTKSRSSARKFRQRQRQGREAGDKKGKGNVPIGSASEPPPAPVSGAANQDANVSLPILVVGMPKAGTTDIASFFQCGNRHNVSHHECTTNNKCGIDLRNNVLAGRPPLDDTGEYDVYAQLDAWALRNTTTRFGKLRCYMPQVENLDEIHAHYPQAMLVLNTRPVDKWIQSLRAYNDGSMWRQMIKCNITGLPEGTGERDDELRTFYEGHLERIRKFAKAHPSHKFVEVDVESPDAGVVLEQAFGIDRSCWRHENKSLPKKKKEKVARKTRKKGVPAPNKQKGKVLQK